MRKITFFLAFLVFAVHGSHALLRIQPAIGDWLIPIWISRLFAIFSVWVMGRIIYHNMKKKH